MSVCTAFCVRIVIGSVTILCLCSKVKDNKMLVYFFMDGSYVDGQ